MLPGRPSSEPAPASTTSGAVLSSMSTPPSDDISSEVEVMSTVTAGRPELSTKQQLTATESLPIEVLVNLSKRLEPKQVHTQALVCGSWRSAVAAATSSISVHFTASTTVDLNTTSKAASLRQWIRNSGAGVRELNIVGPWRQMVPLPLAELRQLQVLSVKNIEIGQWDGAITCTCNNDEDVAGHDADDIRYRKALSRALAASNGLSLLTSLTKLSLTQYSVIGSFNMLSALTQLQELYLTPASSFTDPDITCQGKISTAALQQLTRLTSLSISPSTVEHSATSVISKLSKLQKLAYVSTFIQQASQLAGLPSSLTHFKAAWGGSPLLNMTLAPDLAKVTALQHLELSRQRQSYISACLARHMTQLTHLALSGLCESALEMLSVVAQLHELRHLKLRLSNNDAVVVAFEQQGFDQYSALTASRHLTHLDLLFGRKMFPHCVGKYIFPEGRQLLNLKILKLGQDPVVGGVYLRILDQHVLDRIVQNCPEIEQLSLLRATLDASVDELVTTQLTGLTQLAIGGRGFRDSTITETLPRLTQIRHLKLSDIKMTYVGVLEMTQLTGLTQLEMHRPISSAGTGFMDHGLYLQSNEKRPAPVWQQLQTLCRQSSACAKVLLHRAEAELAESRQREQDLIHQLAAMQLQFSAVQQQLQHAMQVSPGTVQQRQPELARGTTEVGSQTEDLAEPLTNGHREEWKQVES